jgi:tetratricopeptide (TPR) repeat protein
MASAEEYFSLGMAYFDLGLFEDAERWLNRARQLDKTRTASEYNLGRIAYERGRYGEAARYFDRILAKDPSNVMALKAAAYTRIKTGDFARAEELYRQVLLLVPESADDGYNYALVLYHMENYERAEEILAAYPFALEESNEALLLYARSQGAQGKPEAVDQYARWLKNGSDPLVRYEYARALEKEELYARALEQYRDALMGLPADNQEPGRPFVRFTLARLLLIADAENGGGIRELRTAVEEGYANTERITALLDEGGIREEDKAEIRTILDEIAAKAKAETEGPAPETEESAPGDEIES